jgi:hypothetical protein
MCLMLNVHANKFTHKELNGSKLPLGFMAISQRTDD